MSSSGTVSKATAERHQRILLDLLKEPGNDVCADCQTRNPRWASWNLGIFICVKCAGIHRKMGTHITKVKSVTLDSWTKEQVQCMKQFGNFKSNQIFNPNDAKHPPPTNLVESERDSQLEKFIRMKYASTRFMAPPRRNESVGSCSASVSSGVSFTMSNSPTHSPASSIYQQPSSKSSSLPFRSPSAAATTRTEGRPAGLEEQSTAGGANWPTSPKTTASNSSPLKARFDAAAWGAPTHDFKTPVPPLRASTAPIPSDGPPNPQSIAPPLPTSLCHGPGYNIFQTIQSKKQESLPSAQLIQPSLGIHSYHTQSVPKIQDPSAPPLRRDGVWGDLMQLAEPTNLNPNVICSHSPGSTTTPVYSSNWLNPSNPYSQPAVSSTRVSKLETGIGKSMNESSINVLNSLTNGVDVLSQHVGPHNSFSNQLRQGHSTPGTFQPFPSVQPSTFASNPFGGTAGPSSAPTNPFMNSQYAYRIDSNLLSSTNLNPQQSVLPPPSLSRNPFLNSNQISFNSHAPSTIVQFGNNSNHQQNSQLSTLPLSHHPTPFF